MRVCARPVKSPGIAHQRKELNKWVFTTAGAGVVATGIRDRLLHHNQVVTIRGGYRLRGQRKPRLKLNELPEGPSSSCRQGPSF